MVEEPSGILPYKWAIGAGSTFGRADGFPPATHARSSFNEHKHEPQTGVIDP